MTEPHPTWGRLIEDYVASYELDSFLQELVPNATPGTTFLVIAAEPLRFVNEISKIGAEHDEVQIKSLAKDVDLKKLKAILEITSVHQSFLFLHNTQLVPGCIKLLKVMNTSEEQSLFRYEYGYLCFRIISIVLSLFLADNMEGYGHDGVIGLMRVSPEVHPLTTLDKIAEILSVAEFDPVEATEFKKSAKLDTLLPLQAASTLLNLVWINRKTWFKVLSATYTPGLPAVMLLFWQVGNLASLNSPGGIHGPLGVSIYDILWRCCLVCTKDQEMAVRCMMNDVKKVGDEWWQDIRPILDIEDSRAIIHAYLRRLKPTNSAGEKLPDLILVYSLIVFVTRFVQPEAEDLLPCLIGDTIDVFWQCLIDNQFGYQQIVLKFGRMFIYLLKMIDNILPRASDSTKEQLLDRIDKSNLIDLIARTLLLCMSGVPGGAYFHEDAGHPDFMTCTNEVCIHLQESIPRHMFEPKFSHILDDWIKYYNVVEYRCEMGGASEEHRENSRHVQGVWKRVLHTLVQAENLGAAIRCVPPLCSYARCPFPWDRFGTRHRCSQCPVGYCSIDCQTRDWVHGSELGPHSRRCELISRLGSVGIHVKH